MPGEAELTKLNAREFAERFRQEMVPLSNTFAYFSAVPLSEEDTKEYLEEPVTALPPAIHSGIPRISILLVPYLEKPAGKEAELVTFEKPEPKCQVWSTHFLSEGEGILVLAIKDQQVADYHYIFYRAIASLLADSLAADAQGRYFGLLREELRSRVHGEVDQKSWELKQTLLRRQTEVRRETKLFREYARQSLIDTLTLYLHGICCDIDVETGPRQLASRHLRKRLQLLHELFPPPQGYAVFPEELNKA
jgi:hypothetical protein